MVSLSYKVARSDMLEMIISMIGNLNKEDLLMKEKQTSGSWWNPIYLLSQNLEVLTSHYGSWIKMRNSLLCLLNLPSSCLILLLQWMMSLLPINTSTIITSQRNAKSSSVVYRQNGILATDLVQKRLKSMCLNPNWCVMKSNSESTEHRLFLTCSTTQFI